MNISKMTLGEAVKFHRKCARTWKRAAKKYRHYYWIMVRLAEERRIQIEESHRWARKMKAERDELEREKEHSRAHITDLETSIEDMCNGIWAIMYPDDPNGWGYRTQPLVHIREYIDELKLAGRVLLGLTERDELEQENARLKEENERQHNALLVAADEIQKANGEIDLLAGMCKESEMDNADLNDERTRLRQLIKQVEWVTWYQGYHEIKFCTRCRRFEEEGHSPTCP
ncbi:MAG: hypothetical protein ACYS30_24915, partial [Planctomycetota bacterium]